MSAGMLRALGLPARRAQSLAIRATNAFSINPFFQR